MWYSSPVACFYDLLQFSLGQRSGLKRRSDEVGWERVVLACGVELGRGEDKAEVETCAGSGRYI